MYAWNDPCGQVTLWIHGGIVGVGVVCIAYTGLRPELALTCEARVRAGDWRCDPVTKTDWTSPLRSGRLKAVSCQGTKVPR